MSHVSQTAAFQPARLLTRVSQAAQNAVRWTFDLIEEVAAVRDEALRRLKA